MKSILTESDKLFIQENYSKLGSAECGKALGHPTKRIASYASKHSLKVSHERMLRKQQENIKRAQSKRKVLGENPKSYHVNHLQFSNTCSQEAAYILGLLWADGYIYKDSIKIECVKKDLQEIEWVFDKLGTWAKGYRERIGRKPQMTISTNNKLFSQFLRNNDYLAKSTISADKILSIIPSHLHYLWFRGLVDGDGCFYVNETNKTYQFSIASSYDQDWSFVERLLQTLQIKYNITRRKQLQCGKLNRSSCIRISNRTNIVKLGDYLYNDFEITPLGLKRKWIKYKLLRDGLESKLAAGPISSSRL